MSSVRNQNIACIRQKSLYYGPTYKTDNIHEKQWGNLDLSRESVYLFSNIKDIDFLCDVEKKTDYYGGGIEAKIPELHMLPLYIYYEIDVFEELIRFYDIRKLCNIYRIVLIVGEVELESWFSGKGVIFPGKIIEEQGTYITSKICSLFKKKQEELAVKKENIINYYTENNRKIIDNILRRSGKVLIPRYTYEPLKFKRYFEIIKNGFERNGFQVIVNDVSEAVTFSDDIEILDQEKPDIVFVINKCKNGEKFSGEAINLQDYQGLVFINWLQDIYPMAFDKSYNSMLTDRDYVYSFHNYKFLHDYGYEEKNLINSGIMPISCEKFDHHDLTKDEIAKYECDICFAGTVMTSETTMKFIVDSFESFLTIDQIEIVTEKIINIIQTMYDLKSTKYIMKRDNLYRLRDELQLQFQCSEIEATAIYRALDIIIYVSFRRLVLEQLAKMKKYRIRYYGESDLNIPGIEYGGYIFDEVEMSKALQASKVVLQLNPSATMNQRVLETILSDSTVLIYKMDESEDVALCRKFLDENEGHLYFSSKNELIGQIDYLITHEDERQRISAAGKKKILDTLTPEKIMDSMVEHLLEHLRKIK